MTYARMGHIHMDTARRHFVSLGSGGRGGRHGSHRVLVAQRRAPRASGASAYASRQPYGHGYAYHHHVRHAGG
jgi:hypothetical protein